MFVVAVTDNVFVVETDNMFVAVIDNDVCGVFFCGGCLLLFFFFQLLKSDLLENCSCERPLALKFLDISVKRLHK